MRTILLTSTLLFGFLSAAFGACGVTFNPQAGAPAASANAYTVTLTITGSAVSPDNCNRAVASSNSDWLVVTFGQSGTGSGGSFGYTVGDNLSPLTRTGTISVSFADKSPTATYQVRQAGAVCAYTISPTSITFGSKGAAPVNLQVTTKCIWTASTSADWLTLSSTGSNTGNGSITVATADNETPSSRTATVTINDQVVPVRQLGIQCTYTVLPSTVSVPAAGGPAQFSVNTDPACAWTVTNNSPWITVTGTSPTTGPGNVNLTIAANALPQSRVANLGVAGQRVSVSQLGVGITFSAASIQNASSFAGGALSPGEIFVIYGTGMGPQSLVTLQTTPDGTAISTNLANTRVLFDGVPAPMIYTSAAQLSGIVPYSVAAPGAAHITVEYIGIPSSPVTVNTIQATPGIFTLNQQGSGAGAVRNQDFSINGPGNAATAGQALIVYWTGGGALSPAAPDGLLVSVNPPYPNVLLPVTATLGGAPASIGYAGAVPTLAPGILQANIIIPDNAPKGDAVALLIRVGNFVTQTGVTVAIK